MVCLALTSFTPIIMELGLGAVSFRSAGGCAVRLAGWRVGSRKSN